MNFNWAIIGDKIFGILKGSGYKLQMFDKEGKKTLDPHEANRFFATVPSNDPDLIEFNILVSVHDENRDSHLDIKTPNLENQEDFETINKLKNSLKTNVGDREGLSVNWLKFDHTIRPKDEAVFNIVESKDISKPFGSTKSSYQRVGNSKLILRHNDVVDEGKQGSRWRHVKQIFIENAIGERFLYPHLHVAGARAMARHLSNDGTMHDEIGKAICELSEDYMGLKKSARLLRSNGNESKTLALREAMHDINKRVKSLCGPRGYSSLATALVEKTEFDEDKIHDIHTKLMDSCGCGPEDPVAQDLHVAAKYLVNRDDVLLDEQEENIMEFTKQPDLVSRIHEFTDQKERLAWQVSEMAECVADHSVRDRLYDIATLLKSGAIIEPKDIELVREVYMASKGIKHEPTVETDIDPDIDRIRELSGI